MPQVASKLKKLPRMTTNGIQKRVGRVFCVTGYTSTGDLISPASSTTNMIGQSDTESNSSGYLSSSSFESSGEEKRLGLNEQKVFQVWEKWSQQRDQPRNSTPKNADCTYKARINLSINDSRLSIKKNIGAKLEDKEQDSFWGIATPQLFKSRSENDMRSECENRIHSMDVKRDLFENKGLKKHDAGSVPNMSSRRLGNISKSNDWKRKPYHTLSSSDQDLRLNGKDTSSDSGYRSLPRYRVVVDESTSKIKSSSATSSTSSSSEIVNKLSQYCADFSDSGVPVDESMTEFLANVDKDNLACFLNFYDKVTSGSAYERARKNTNNYEAVYF